MAGADPDHVLPVFIPGKSLPAAEEKEYSVYEICAAAEKLTGFGNVVGAQRIGALWRLYPKTNNARLSLLTKGVVVRGYCVQCKDKNPFVVRDEMGEEKEVPSVRLTVGNVPLSYSNDEIINYIDKLPGVKTRSRLIDERARDDKGKLSHFKTGRRFIYINTPSEPLPKTINIGIFQATLYHPGQKTVTCSKCLEKGHHFTACAAEVKCRQCYQYGHKKGDPECQLAPTVTPEDSGNTDQINLQLPVEQQTKKSPATAEKKQASLAGMLARRGRSATPTRAKRQRSPSLQRSPRTAGTKNVRSTTRQHSKDKESCLEEKGMNYNRECELDPPP